MYKGLLKKDAIRRKKNKEASLAKNKALCKPFSFNERDTHKARLKALSFEDIDDHMLYQFRARNIPWGILIPRFEMMR